MQTQILRALRVIQRFNVRADRAQEKAPVPTVMLAKIYNRQGKHPRSSKGILRPTLPRMHKNFRIRLAF